MKNLLGFALLVALTASFSGCGGETAPAPETKETKTTTTTAPADGVVQGTLVKLSVPAMT